MSLAQVKTTVRVSPIISSRRPSLLKFVQACVSAAFVAPRLMLRVVDLRLFVFPWLPCPGSCRSLRALFYARSTLMLSRSFSLRSQYDVVAQALDTGSNVSSGQAAKRMESKLELRQPRCHRCVHVRSCESLQWFGLWAFIERSESRT